jgi:hypothetical protein
MGTGPFGLWNLTHAVLIAIGLLGGLLVVWLAARGRVRVVGPFRAGAVPGADDDRIRVFGPRFYETVGRLPALGPLLREGQAGAMDLYCWFGRYGNSFVQILRAQHTGLVCLYAAWAVLGLMVTLAYLLIAGT